MTLPLPEAWERAEDPAPGLVLVAIEPEHDPDDDPGFRANLVVTLDKLDDGLGLDDWQAGTERLFPRVSATTWSSTSNALTCPAYAASAGSRTTAPSRTAR